MHHLKETHWGKLGLWWNCCCVTSTCCRYFFRYVSIFSAYPSQLQGQLVLHGHYSFFTPKNAEMANNEQFLKQNWFKAMTSIIGIGDACSTADFPFSMAVVLSGRCKNCPDSFRTVWTVLKLSGQFSNCLDGFKTVRMVSKLSRRFQNCPYGFKTVRTD